MEHFVLATAIAPLTMMWISFYSIGFMALSMVLIHLARHKISNVIVSAILKLIAYVFLIVGALTMIFVIFYW